MRALARGPGAVGGEVRTVSKPMPTQASRIIGHSAGPDTIASGT